MALLPDSSVEAAAHFGFGNARELIWTESQRVIHVGLCRFCYTRKRAGFVVERKGVGRRAKILKYLVVRRSHTLPGGIVA